MRLHSWVMLGALSSVAIAQGEPAADPSLTWTSPATVPVAKPTPAMPQNDNRPRYKRYHHSWMLQKRATTTDDAATTEDPAATTAEETTSATEAATTDATTAAATTTDAATTTTAAETTSTTSSTSSTSSTTTSTSSTSSTSSSTSTTSSSSTSQSTTSSSTTSTKTTSTTSTTTSSTSSATSTTSAEMREYNRKGTLAAIITFSILGSIFVGYACFHCFHESSKKKRRLAAAAKAAAAGSSYSMVPLADGPGSQSDVNFDRKSMMFATQSRTDLESIAFPAAGSHSFNQPVTRPSSMAASETLHQSPVLGAHPQEQRGNFI
ncbi:hypothetical protein BBP40_011923 [Aspergillus hancockii]|nr:hypothetical protein BBP40_011923 [Aspergillus hancockii]